VSADLAAVEAANAAMYEAFETADVDRMARVWDEADAGAVVCVHPGWPMLRGRDHVLRSWSAVMAGTDYIQFFLTDVQISVLGRHRDRDLHRERPHRGHRAGQAATRSWPPTCSCAGRTAGACRCTTARPVLGRLGSSR
jgi:hypothetical protein